MKHRQVRPTDADWLMWRAQAETMGIPDDLAWRRWKERRAQQDDPLNMIGWGDQPDEPRAAAKPKKT